MHGDSSSAQMSCVILCGRGWEYVWGMGVLEALDKGCERVYTINSMKNIFYNAWYIHRKFGEITWPLP